MQRRKQKQMEKMMGLGRGRGMEHWAELLAYHMLIN